MKEENSKQINQVTSDTMTFEEAYSNTLMFCPICQLVYPTSRYLYNTIFNRRTAYFANLVTHYRHYHISSWNKCWDYNGKYYRRKWFTDYETEKSIVNERAKRQIIRKSHRFLNILGVTVEDIIELEANDPDTIDIINKYLKHKN